jgi:hypothetical protein
MAVSLLLVAQFQAQEIPIPLLRFRTLWRNSRDTGRGRQAFSWFSLYQFNDPSPLIYSWAKTWAGKGWVCPWCSVHGMSVLGDTKHPKVIYIDE